MQLTIPLSVSRFPRISIPPFAYSAGLLHPLSLRLRTLCPAMPSTSLPPSMTTGAAVAHYTGQTPQQLGLIREIYDERSADQLRLILINDVRARQAISSCYMYAYELCYPACVWDWVQDCLCPAAAGWDRLVRLMTRPVPYWPTCDAGHCWNSTLLAAPCQFCGQDNDERRIVIRFLLAGQDGIVTSFLFTCLHAEWSEALAVLKEVKRTNSGKKMQLDYSVDAVYPHIRYPQAGLDFDRITNLEVLQNHDECEKTIAALQLPRVTPSFLKRLIAAPCELGKHGRCFCSTLEGGGRCCAEL